MKFSAFKGEWKTFQKEFEQQLSDRKFSPSIFNERKYLTAGDLYIEIEMARKNIQGKFYKDCVIDLKLKQAKYTRPNSADKILFKSHIVRNIPRVTFKGNERCVRGMGDVFIEIPVCEKN